MEQIDRAAIFLNLCLRQKLRREARLPLLDLKGEYLAAIAIAEAAQRRAIRQQYVPEIKAEILSRMRAIHGATWPRDLGSRYYLGALVNRTIFERYGV
jgi:hypothetical protein